MGFGTSHVNAALAAVATNSIEVAMEWLLTHPPTEAQLNESLSISLNESAAAETEDDALERALALSMAGLDDAADNGSDNDGSGDTEMATELSGGDMEMPAEETEPEPVEEKYALTEIEVLVTELQESIFGVGIHLLKQFAARYNTCAHLRISERRKKGSGVT
jgi:hypothetical protein